jgi:hypothetical protein
VPVNLLSDVDVVAVSLVDKGANRKRFYLRKAEDSEELFTLPGPHNLLKTDDWSVVYSVVAEPGWRENAGSGSPGESTEDEWASEDEIRSAAHRFMKNGALVNEMHRNLQPYGRVVENFVAQVDFEVEGEVIKAGSWVIGIEPSEQGRTKIENGEFTGVSIQGTGLRTLDLSKATLSAAGRKSLPGSAFVFPKEKRYPIHDRAHAANALARSSGKPEAATVRRVVCARYPDLPACKAGKVSKRRGPGGDIARNQGVQFGPLRHLIAFYLKKPHPFTSCVRDNRKRFGPRAEKVCAALKDIGLQTTDWRKGGKMKMRKAADVPEEMYGQALVIWKQHDLTEEDAEIAWEGVMDDQERSLLTKIGEKLGIRTDDDCGCGDAEQTVEGKVAPVEITKEDFDKLATKVDTNADAVEKSAKAVESLANRVADIAEALANSKKKDDDEDELDPAEEVYHRLDEVAKSVEDIRGDVEKLAKGQSAQPHTDNGKVEKSQDDWKVGLFD